MQGESEVTIERAVYQARVEADALYMLIVELNIIVRESPPKVVGVRPRVTCCVKPWSGIEELAFHAFERLFSRTQTAPRSNGLGH